MAKNKGPDVGGLKTKVIKLQRNTGALLALLGGDEDDRLRFWEILKGITTPADFRLVSHQLDVMTAQLGQLQSSVKTLERAAKEIGG